MNFEDLRQQQDQRSQQAMDSLFGIGGIGGIGLNNQYNQLRNSYADARRDHEQARQQMGQHINDAVRYQTMWHATLNNAETPQDYHYGRVSPSILTEQLHTGPCKWCNNGLCACHTPKPLPCCQCGNQPTIGFYPSDLNTPVYTCTNLLCPWGDLAPVQLSTWNEEQIKHKKQASYGTCTVTQVRDAQRGRVWRFFNRFKLKARYCLALPWRGAKAVARFCWYKTVSLDWAEKNIGDNGRIPGIYKRSPSGLFVGMYVPR